MVSGRDTMKKKSLSDVVNHPSHYTQGQFEVIEVIEDWELDFHLGNVVKYVARSPYKGEQLQDLLKAQWYLQRKIHQLQSPTQKQA
jgi:hypothetical protein